MNHELSVQQSEFHVAWTREEHGQFFDTWRFLPRFALRTLLEQFNEVRLLREVLSRTDCPTRLLEIGCATGEFYRYLASTYPTLRYVGCDISAPAIRRARAKYPRAAFIQTDQELSQLSGPADLVFCRDVVHHQPDPFPFLARLYGLTNRFLILRLRTRDRGATLLDPERSCQFHYGEWVPFIVMNCDEIVEACRRFSPRPSRLTFLKHYMVLGGQYRRFLPKECYDPSTGTAETALLVERQASGTEMQIMQRAQEEGIHGGLPRISFVAGLAAGRALRMLLRSRPIGRTWW